MVAVYALGALAANAGGVLGTVGSAATATSAATAGTGLAGVIAGTTAGAASALGSFMGLNVGIWLGATVGAAWSAINTTIAGGSFGQVLKSAVIGAANGAVNAIIGGYMHGLGVAQGSMLAGGTSISGTAIHLAAHGVAGGAMSEANGGSFRDGFIGGVLGAGMTGIGMKLYGGTALATSDKVWAIAGRTAIAAVSGGLGSMALGGKFADGAYSAAFFHLFNNEAKRFSDRLILFNEDSALGRLSIRLKLKGTYLLGGHANMLQIMDQRKNGGDLRFAVMLSPEKTYQMMLADGYTNGTPVSILGCEAALGADSFAMRLSILTQSYVGGANQQIVAFVGGQPYIEGTKWIKTGRMNKYDVPEQVEVPDKTVPAHMRWFHSGKEFFAPSFHRWAPNHGLNNMWEGSKPSWLK
ncbi:MAG: hypothetical protein NTV80_13680 [Verrucomicrobia bacterium]|nr:hypothetical protein [Verrucomicrobiota bacterium]